MEKAEAARSMMGTMLLGLVSVVLLSAGQTLLKVGLNRVGGFNLAEGVASLSKLIRTPWIAAGLACYVMSSILWLEVLSKLEFSLAFPMMGLTYVFALVIGRFFFGESITWDRILAVGLIVCGILLLTRSASPPK